MFNLNKTATIGIFGHYGNLNMGDEAIITAVIQNVRQRMPQAKLIAFSLKPEDTTARYDIPAYPIRYLPSSPSKPSARAERSTCKTQSRIQQASGDTGLKTRAVTIKKFIMKMPLMHSFLRTVKNALHWPVNCVTELVFLGRVYKILRGVDLLVITGSNQFLDNFGGPWGFPYTLLKWSVLAKMAGAQVIYVSVGAGPVDSKLSKILIRLALRFSEYTSFRDLPSQKLIESMGFKGPSSVYPDLAYSLFREDDVDDGLIQPPAEIPITVGINVMPVYSDRYWCTHDNEKYTKYVATLASFASILLREGYGVFFWGTQIRDEGAIEDAMACLDKEPGSSADCKRLIRTNRSVSELIDVLKSADVLVTTRFHGAVLSLFARKAVLAVCYHRKIKDLMKEMGQVDYTIKFEELKLDDLLQRFRLLEKHIAIEVPKITKTVEAYRQSLDQQYDVLFGPAPGQQYAEKSCARPKIDSRR